MNLRSLHLAFLIFVFAGIGSKCFGQHNIPVSPNTLDQDNLRTGHWTLLYDSAWKEVTVPDSAVYYRLIRFEAGKPVGKVRDFYQTGNKQWEGYLSSLNPDVLEGEALTFYENGRINLRQNYSKGELNGEAEIYTPEGRLLATGQYRNNKREGIWTIHIDDGSTSQIEMRNDSPHGINHRFFPNGKPAILSTKINGNAVGVWQEFYENGNMKLNGFYNDGLAQGLYETFHPNGRISERGYYKDDIKTGWWTTYDSAGVLLSEGNYDKAGLKTGRWKTYHQNSKPSSAGMWSEGYQAGEWMFFYDNGTVSSRGVLMNNMWEGEAFFYHRNGKLHEHGFYKRDTVDGQYEEYFESGTIKTSGKKVMGVETGEWKTWYENGTLESEGRYDHGLKEGPWQFYYESGALYMKTTYVKDILEGEVLQYHEAGGIKGRLYYSDGKRNGLYESFYESGQLEMQVPYSGDEFTGDFIQYYPDGTKKSVYVMAGNLGEGPFAEWYPNGTKSVEGTLVHSQKDGWSRWYYRHGGLKEEGNYEMGMQTGKWLYYDSVSGRLNLQGALVNGRFDGKWLYYDKEGKLTNTRYFISGWEENSANIRDSIENLVKAKKYDEAFSATKWLHNVLKRDLKGQKPTLHLSVTGTIYAAQNNYAAAYKWASLYLKKISRYQGPKTTDYKTAVHNVATYLHGQSLYDEALARYDEAIELSKSTGLSETYWSSVNNKVYCLYDAGRTDEGGAIFQRELEAAERLYGSDAPPGWYLRHAVAEYYYSRPADYTKAYELFLDLLNDVRVNDSTHRYMYECSRRLGVICRASRNNPDSAAMHNAFAIRYAEKHRMTALPEYADLIVEQFYIYHNGRYGEAGGKIRDELARKMLALLPGTSNPGTRLDLNQALGHHLYRRDQVAECIPFMENAVADMDAAGMKNTTSHAMTLQTLAVAIHSVYPERFPEVEKIYNECLAILKDKVGEKVLSYYSSYVEFARLYANSGYWSRSNEMLLTILPVVESVGDRENVAKVRYYLASNYNNLLDHANAIKNYTAALEYSEEASVPNKGREQELLEGLASNYKFLDDYEKAKEFAQRRIKVAELHYGKNTTESLAAVCQLAEIHAYNDVYSEAINLYQQYNAEILKLEGNGTSNHLKGINGLAGAYAALGQSKKVIQLLDPYHTAAGVKAQVSAERLDQIKLLANAFENQKDYKRAEELLNELEGTARSYYGQGSTSASVYSLEKALFYVNRNRMPEAESLFEELVAINRNTEYGRTSVLSTFISRLADVKEHLDKNKEAEQLYKESFAIAAKDSTYSENTYYNASLDLVSFYTKMGRFDEAEKLVQSTAAYIERRRGRANLYVKARSNLVYIYYKQGRPHDAEKVANELISVLEGEVSPWDNMMLTLHNYLGIIADYNNDFRKAIQEYQYVIDAVKQKKELTEFEKSNLAIYYRNLGRAEISLGNFALAATHLEQADKLEKDAGVVMDMNRMIIRQANYAALNFDNGHQDEAIRLYSGVVTSLLKYTGNNFYFMNDEEKTKFWLDYKGYFNTFHSMASQRVRQRPSLAGDMYNIQLATKAILLSASNKIRKRILSSGDTAMINTFNRWQRLHNEIAKEYEQLTVGATGAKARVDTLLSKANVLEKDLNITAEDMIEDKGGSRVRWTDIQSLLKKDEAAVEIMRFRHYTYHVTDSLIYAALIITSETRNAPELVFFTDGKQLEERYYRFYKNQIAMRIDDTVSYRYFWAPLEKALNGKTRIYLSQDGVFNNINLNTLRRPKGGYLVDNTNITLVANTKDVLSIKSRKVRRLNNNTAVLLGYPKYFIGKENVLRKLDQKPQRDFDAAQLSESDNTGIPELPGTRTEIETIRGILNRQKLTTRFYTSEEATESAIKRISHPLILHIATHGFFKAEGEQTLEGQEALADNPLTRSGLLLAGAANFIQNKVRLDGENGILTAYEAANLNLEGTDLVILSACETGKGKLENGEGVYGLQRAFQTAGAKSIIMSLWKVDDEATQKLMTTFYSLWSAGLPRSDAWKKAQLALKESFPHPYYWGAFVMMEN